MSKVFVRYPYHLGDYNDDTNTGPGMTDQSMHETMSDLVARVLRGEVVTKNQMIYDFDEDCKLSEDEQFDSMDITQEDGFEMSDAPVVLETLKSEIFNDQASAHNGDSKEDGEAPTQSNEPDEKESE